MRHKRRCSLQNGSEHHCTFFKIFSIPSHTIALARKTAKTDQHVCVYVSDVIPFTMADSDQYDHLIFDKTMENVQNTRLKPRFIVRPIFLKPRDPVPAPGTNNIPQYDEMKTSKRRLPRLPSQTFKSRPSRCKRSLLKNRCPTKVSLILHSKRGRLD